MSSPLSGHDENENDDDSPTEEPAGEEPVAEQNVPTQEPNQTVVEDVASNKDNVN